MVGNVVEDRQPGGGWAPGGPSLYSARTAAALGASVTLVTRLPRDYDSAVLSGIEVVALPAAVAPRYANTYDAAGDRTQLLLDPGEPLDELPPIDRPIDAVIVAPAYHELGNDPARAWTRYAAPVKSISLQGLLRSATPEGRVIPAGDPERRALLAIEPGVTAFYSEEDATQPEALADAITRGGAVAVLTRGYRGATVYTREEVIRLDALPAHPHDPTGAGDCFATAYTVRLAEVGDIREAARFAIAAGAVAVEGAGLQGVPNRRQVEERLAPEAA